MATVNTEGRCFELFKIKDTVISPSYPLVAVWAFIDGLGAALLTEVLSELGVGNEKWGSYVPIGAHLGNIVAFNSGLPLFVGIYHVFVSNFVSTDRDCRDF